MKPLPGYTVGHVTISRRVGYQEVDALIHRSGLFAITPAVYNSDRWTVTHIPTGYALTLSAIKINAARRIVKVALAADIDWTERNVEHFDAHKGDPARVELAATIKEICRHAL